MAASACDLPTPGLPAATTLIASSRNVPLRSRSSCWRMRGGNCSSCRVRKVLSGGKPESRSSRATRCSSRWRHSARSNSYRNSSWVRLALAALSARSSYTAAIAGNLRPRSISRISAWRSGTGCLLAEQPVVHAQVQPRSAQLRNALGGRGSRQIPHHVESRHDVLFEQQPECRLDLAFGRAGGQMQHPHVVPIGTFRGLALERVERAGLAHQRPDDVTVVDGVLDGPEQPRHAEQMRSGAVDLQRLGAHPHQQRRADQARGDRVRVLEHADGAEAADGHADFAARQQWRQRQRPQGLTLLSPAHLARQVALTDQLLQEPIVGAAVGKIAAAAHAQRLIDGVLEAVVLLFDVAVLVGDADVVGRRFQVVVRHQEPVAFPGLGTRVRIQRADGRTEMIGAMLARYAAYSPKAGLEAFNQALVALAEADLNGLDV